MTSTSSGRAEEPDESWGEEGEGGGGRVRQEVERGKEREGEALRQIIAH